MTTNWTYKNEAAEAIAMAIGRNLHPAQHERLIEALLALGITEPREAARWWTPARITHALLSLLDA